MKEDDSFNYRDRQYSRADMDLDQKNRELEAIRNRAARELAEKQREVETLKAMMSESAIESPFQPRASIARTPPGQFSPAPASQLPITTPLSQTGTHQTTGKRILTSPEEVQEALRRRIEATQDPLEGTPSSSAVGTQEPHPAMNKEELVQAVHAAVKAISAVANAPNKLNMGDRNAIAGHGQDIIAIVAQLALRLAGMEHEVCATKLKAKEQELSRPAAVPAFAAPVVPSYANALKLPNGKPPIQVAQQGPAVIFYPAREDIKTSDDTKKILQDAIKPAESGIRVSQVKRVGNAGLMVRPTTAEGAAKLRSAVPPGLRIAEPRSRLPRVALRYLRSDITGDALLEELHRINLADDADWPLQRLKAECKFAVSKQLGQKYLVILECSKAARDVLINLGRVYVGWDEAEVCDHLRVTCCSKCQQYGHPEKYCRAQETTCSRCGETGHRHTECKSQTQCCATCKRFRRKDANSHPTAAASCPARQHAENEAANMTQYAV